MKKMIFSILLAIFFLIPFGVFAETEEVVLSKCVDGDTAKFKIKDSVKSTRFIAIDTPESVHPKKKVEPFGKEASNYTCERLKNAKKIVLEYDEGSTKTDKYDRVIAWVFVDDVLLQEELVEKGYAKVAYLYGDYKYTEKLQEKEKIAKEKKLKIWGDNVDKSLDDQEEFNKLVEILKKFAKKVLKKIENML